ncbi:MAG: mechanosensitive ion channel [Actinomycetota bacterium]|nr:mechanosensitive ion channel [Actinomycetota bacterium]
MANTANDLLTAITDFVPRILGAVGVLLAMLLLAIVLQRLATRALEDFGLDSLFERTGASDSLWKLGYTGGPSRLLGYTLFWGVMLAAVASVLSILGLSSLETTTNQLVNLSGRALVALVIIMAGVMAAGWLAGLIAREAENAGLRGPATIQRIVFVAVVSVATLVSASQLGLNTTLIVILAIVVLATIGVAAALAIGQGLVLLSGNIAASRYVQDGINEGDVISVNGIEGTVEELGYAALTIRSEDGQLYRIPNQTLLQNIVRKQG